MCLVYKHFKIICWRKYNNKKKIVCEEAPMKPVNTYHNISICTAERNKYKKINQRNWNNKKRKNKKKFKERAFLLYKEKFNYPKAISASTHMPTRKYDPQEFWVAGKELWLLKNQGGNMNEWHFWGRDLYSKWQMNLLREGEEIQWIYSCERDNKREAH